MKTKSALKILKANLLVLSALLALLFLIAEVSDPTPLGNAWEIIVTFVCGAWLILFSYAQFTTN